MLIGIGIVYLRLFSSYPDSMVYLIKGIMALVNYYLEALNVTFLTSLFASVSSHKIIFIAVLLHIIIGGLILSVFEEKYRKSINILLSNICRVIRWGFILYVLLGMSFLILLFSVAGSAGAAIIAVLLTATTLIGGVSVAVAIGYNVKKMLNIRANLLIMYMLGEFVMAICTSVSVLAGAVVLFILPVLSLGTAWCYIMDKCIYKAPISAFRDNEKHFDRDRMREIITEGIDN